MSAFVPKAGPRRLSARVGLASLAALASWAALAGPASAADGCDLVAAPGGSDSATGSEADPLRTAQVLLDSLEPGATGCLRAGTYSADDTIKVATPDVTLMSYPGERAKVVGRFWVAKEGHGATVAGLDLDGRNEADNPSPTINGNDVTLRGNDITNHHTDWYCLSLGNLDGWGRADRALVVGNRIHDCGLMPPTNLNHGLYVAAADDVVIRGNLIYDNADRGIQLYPDAQGALVTGNVIDGNGSGVIISGEGSHASSGNVIEHNVITNSRVRDNVESYWDSRVGTGNVVRDNCIGGGAYDDGDGGILDGPIAEIGFAARNNLIHVPDYADRAAGDFTIPADDPCFAILGGALTPPPVARPPSACAPRMAATHRMAAKLARVRARHASRRRVTRAEKRLQRARARSRAACFG
jgi:nitrous oxidase accessory protein NosD